MIHLECISVSPLSVYKVRIFHYIFFVMFVKLLHYCYTLFEILLNEGQRECFSLYFFMNYRQTDLTLTMDHTMKVTNQMKVYFSLRISFQRRFSAKVKY